MSREYHVTDSVYGWSVCSPTKSAGKRHFSLETRHGQPGKYRQVSFFVDSYLPATTKVHYYFIYLFIYYFIYYYCVVLLL